MNKRLIIIISAIIILLVLIGGLLFVAVKKNRQATVAAVPQLKKVLDETVISPVASYDGNAIWYFNTEGQLFRVNIDGSGLSEFPLPSLSSGTVNSALWPKSGSDFLAISGTGLNQIINYYNSAQKVYTSLPSNIQSIDWLPDSLRVVYIWKSGDNLHQQLVMADADGTGFTTINNVFWPDLVVKAGPDGKTVLLYRSNIQGDVNKIYSADLSTGVIATVIDQGKNTAATWIDSNRFVYAQASTTVYPKLYIYNFTNHQSTDLNLNTTVDKITFDPDGKYLYAAVPKQDNSGDTFIKEDLTTFKQETYFVPDQSISAENLMLIGNSLYFTNSADQKFYTISE